MGEGQLESIIDKAWEDRESITSSTTGEIRDAVEAALEANPSAGTKSILKKTNPRKLSVDKFIS